MTKYFKKDNSLQEVKVGDHVTLSRTLPGGATMLFTAAAKTTDVLETLYQNGFLLKGEISDKPKETPDGEHVPTVGFFIDKLSAALEWPRRRTDAFLNTLLQIYPITAFSILLRVIAEHMDESYPDHIKNSQEFWFISTVNGLPFKVPKEKAIPTLRNAAAFRSKQEAETACRILEKLRKEVFSGK